MSDSIYQLAHITIAMEEVGGSEDGTVQAISFTVPAYTVPTETLTIKVNELLDHYVKLSEEAGEPMSLADFAMLCQATEAARYISEKGTN